MSQEKIRIRTGGIEVSMKKYVLTVITAILLVGAMLGTKMPVYAAMADEAIDYTLGETYRDQHGWVPQYYSFTLDQKSYISLDVTVQSGTVNFTIYGANGKKYLIPSNVAYKKNVTTDIYKGSASRTLPAGTYFLEIGENYKECYFTLQAEAPIKLAKGSISSVKSKKAGQITVSCKSVPNAIGYKIQYSKDYRFRSGVKTVYSPTSTKTFTGLGRGRRYYVRVTPYTVYTNGMHAWGGTSYVKSVVVKR